MDTTIALIGLVLGLVGAIVGAFAYLMGEIRKVNSSTRRDMDNLRDYLNARVEAFAKTEAQERATMRTEFISSTGRIESDLRRLSEAVVRRSDVEQLENRLTRSTERLEQKFDALMTQSSATSFRRPAGPHSGSDRQ